MGKELPGGAGGGARWALSPREAVTVMVV